MQFKEFQYGLLGVQCFMVAIWINAHKYAIDEHENQMKEVKLLVYIVN